MTGRERDFSVQFLKINCKLSLFGVKVFVSTHVHLHVFATVLMISSVVKAVMYRVMIAPGVVVEAVPWLRVLRVVRRKRGRRHPWGARGQHEAAHGRQWHTRR